MSDEWRLHRLNPADRLYRCCWWRSGDRPWRRSPPPDAGGLRSDTRESCRGRHSTTVSCLYISVHAALREARMCFRLTWGCKPSSWRQRRLKRQPPGRWLQLRRTPGSTPASHAGGGGGSKKEMLDPLKQNEMEKRCCMTTHPLTGVSKCVMGNRELAGWPGLGLTPQGLTTVCSASWGENPPSHLSLGTLRYLPNKHVWASAGSLERVCVCAAGLGGRWLWPCLPSWEKLILLSVQT